MMAHVGKDYINPVHNGNFSPVQEKFILKKLKEAGFTDNEVRRLLDEGAVGFNLILK